MGCIHRDSQRKELEAEPQGPEREIGAGHQGLPLYSGGIGIPNMKRLVSKSSEHQVVTSSRVCSGNEARGVEKSRGGLSKTREGGES